MKKILLLTLSALMFSAVAEAEQFDVDAFLNKTYVTIGLGYKLQETELWFIDDGVRTRFDEPFSSRIEIGYNWSRHLKFGVAHYSQYLSGSPFNNDQEYEVTMLFVDFTFTLNDMF